MLLLLLPVLWLLTFLLATKLQDPLHRQQLRLLSPHPLLLFLP
jgi:hypothetical protein